tara:strand:+ start:1144 stop:3345 length:2202 start_codon:yes stop_codon:yes gene_type:complete
VSFFIVFSGPDLSLGVRVDPSIKSLLPNSGEEIEFLENIEELFSSDDLLLVTWVGEDLFLPSHLAEFKALSRKIEQIPGVEDVESLATAIRTKVFEDYTEVNPYLAELPKTKEQATEIRDAIVKNPLYKGYLVSDDGTGLMISVRFKRNLTAQELIKKVSLIDQYSEQSASGIEQFLSGPLFVRLEISRLLLEDLYRVMPLAVLVTLAVLAFGFRNLRGVFLPFLSNTLALGLTFSIFILNGNLLNYVTVILPPTIYVVGFAYSVHVMSDYERYFHSQISVIEAVEKALDDVLVPVSLTAITTATSFFSLTFSNIESIETFGLYACLGTILAWISALIFVPVGLVLFGSNKRKDSITRTGIDQLVRLLAENARARGKMVVLSGALLCVISLWGVFHIDVGTNYLENFDKEGSVRRNFDKMSDVFAGAVPMQIVLSCQQVDCFKEPDVIREILNLQSWLNEQVEIGGVYTFVDYLGTLEEALAPEKVDEDPVPNSKSLISHYLLLGASEDVRRFADASYQSVLLQVRMRIVSSSAINQLSERINDRLTLLNQDLVGKITGSSYLIAQTLDEVTQGQVWSLSTAIIPIFVVLALMFRSFYLAFIALIPNLLPIIVFFGVLGWIGIPLNLTTSLVASVVLGIAVDDSIHFFARLRQKVKKEVSRPLESTIGSVIRPVSFTTAGLSLGFIMLISGQLLSQAEFGLLVAFTLVVAWLLDLTFTPALAHWTRMDSNKLD